MKTTVLKSMMLVGMMSVSTVMFGSTKNDNHHEVMNGHKMEMQMHDQHCMHEMKHGKCLDIHCKCQCHKHNHDMKKGDKGGQQMHDNGGNRGQMNGRR